MRRRYQGNGKFDRMRRFARAQVGRWWDEAFVNTIAELVRSASERPRGREVLRDEAFRGADCRV